jgi:hypothetical protein
MQDCSRSFDFVAQLWAIEVENIGSITVFRLFQPFSVLSVHCPNILKNMTKIVEIQTKIWYTIRNYCVFRQK